MNIILETIDRAFDGYQEIMSVMLKAIEAPRSQVTEYAPKIKILKISPDRVRDVIGK